MALINCPECGKEVSDKASACIHCGYPFSIEKTNSTRSILDLFNEYAMTANVKNDVSSIFQDVVSMIAQVKTSKDEIEVNDQIAKDIIEGLTKIPSYCSWPNVKLFCELIDFNVLSSEAMDYITNQIYSIISVVKHYSDGSFGYSYITQFFYPEYMIMRHGSENNKEKLMTVLNKPFLGKQSGYEYIVSMYRENVGVDSMQQISKIKSELYDRPKCPTCSSTNISKISTTSKVAGAAFFGLFSKTAKSQFKCNNCGYKW